MCQRKKIIVYWSWLMTTIPVIGKRRQDTLEFNDSLGHMPGACLRNPRAGDVDNSVAKCLPSMCQGSCLEWWLIMISNLAGSRLT